MSSLQQLPPSLVLVFALILTALSWRFTAASFQGKAEERFERQVEQIENGVRSRMESYIDALLHTRALFFASDEVTRDDFKNFIDAMQLADRYPGIQGIGYTERVSKQRLDEFERRIREEGFPDFEVWPETGGEFQYSIIYLEPFDWRNRRAFGFDMSSEPTRSSAMNEARDTGDVIASGPVTLVQETEKDTQVGFLVYLPLYSQASTPETVAERRRDLIGFTFAPFRATDLFRGVFGSRITHYYLGFSVYLRHEGDIVEVYSANGSREETPEHKATAELDVAGQTWFLSMYSRPGFLTYTERHAPDIVLIFGLLFSALLYLYVRNERAQRMRTREYLVNEKVSRKKAEQAVKARDDFLSVASHELKTPLTTLLLQLQMLDRRLDKAGVVGEKNRRSVASAIRQVDRLVTLVNDLLDIARIRGGKFKIEPTRVELSRLVRDVVERFEIELERGGYELELDLDGAVVGYWDRYRIEQVIVNLLTNAMKYGREQPIKVEAQQAGKQARIVVEDQGMGIKPEDHEKIFGRFERVSASAGLAGLGLGLYIVRQIVDAHGGRIWVESEPEKGSRFIVELPIEPPFSALASVEYGDDHAGG